jgi:hypothetical protein
MPDLRERRRFPRVASEFPLHYRSIPVARTGYVGASVRDLSLTGVRFRSPNDVRVRSSLLFELLIPGAQPVHTIGRAAWVRELPDREGFEIGGVFEEQSTSVRKALMQHLQSGKAFAGSEAATGATLSGRAESQPRGMCVG